MGGALLRTRFALGLVSFEDPVDVLSATSGGEGAGMGKSGGGGCDVAEAGLWSGGLAAAWPDGFALVEAGAEVRRASFGRFGEAAGERTDPSWWGLTEDPSRMPAVGEARPPTAERREGKA